MKLTPYNVVCLVCLIQSITIMLIAIVKCMAIFKGINIGKYVNKETNVKIDSIDK